MTFTEIPEGGISLGGHAIDRILKGTYPATGSISLGGSSPFTLHYHYSAAGSVYLGGSSPFTLHYHYSAAGRLTTGGKAVVKKGFYQMSGRGAIHTGGRSVYQMRLYFTGGGSIILSGTSPFDYDFFFSLNGTWKVKSIISIEKLVTWNNLGAVPVVEPTIWWWRVTGHCVPPTAYSSGVQLNDPLCGDENGPGIKYVQILTATDLPNLCKRMKETFLTYPLTKWRVQTIEKFSRPLRSDADAEIGKNYQCLIPQSEFCEVPECMDFCLLAGVDKDSYAKIKAKTFIVQAYIAKGGLKLGGKSSVISPSYTWIGSGGIELKGCTDRKLNVVDEYIVVAKAGAAMVSQSMGDSTRKSSVLQWPIETSNVATGCGCTNIPVDLYVTHNLNKLLRLREFLSFNDSVFPVQDVLKYSNGKWSKLYHLIGENVRNIREDWVVRMDWSCTNIERGRYIGSFFWSFSFMARRMVENKSSVFKLVCELEDNTDICVRNKFDIKFYYNPITSLFTTNKGIAAGSVYDQMGMFSNWKNESIVVSISKEVPSPSYTKSSLAPYLPSQNTTTIFGKLLV